MNIEQAIEIMNNFIKDTPKAPFECLMNKEVEAVETLLNYIDTMHKEFDRLEGIEDNTAMLKMELEKKDKVINMMTGWLYAEDTGFGYGALKDINTPEKIQEYFYKKVQK